MGFGDGVVDVPVEPGFEGLADMTVDDGAGDTKSACKVCDVAVLEMGFVQPLGYCEMTFGVLKQFGEDRVVCECGVFGVKNVVELRHIGNGCVVDMRRPKMN